MLTARSTSTRPGSWRRRRLQIGASAADRASVSPERSAISASSRLPALETTPLPSAVTYCRISCALLLGSQDRLLQEVVAHGCVRDRQAGGEGRRVGDHCEDPRRL